MNFEQGKKFAKKFDIYLEQENDLIQVTFNYNVYFMPSKQLDLFIRAMYFVYEKSFWWGHDIGMENGKENNNV